MTCAAAEHIAFLRYSNCKPNQSFFKTKKCPDATVNHITIFLILTWDFILTTVLLNLASISLNIMGWIKLIYDKITEISKVKNGFNPTFEVDGDENEVLQKCYYSKLPFRNGTYHERI